jgi:predicted esterase
VFVYLHGRGSNVREHCRQLHEVVQHYGWLLCPIGPVDRGGDRREWNNNRDYAARATLASIDALVALHPRRARRHDNVMIGFSEGSYVGMNTALMNPRTFPRWLIIAADDRYIDSERERIERAAQSVQRAYLLTGVDDVTLPHSRRAHALLERAFGRRRERFRVQPGMGHQLPGDGHLVRNILDWLTR